MKIELTDTEFQAAIRQYLEARLKLEDGEECMDYAHIHTRDENGDFCEPFVAASIVKSSLSSEHFTVTF